MIRPDRRPLIALMADRALGRRLSVGMTRVNRQIIWLSGGIWSIAIIHWMNFGNPAWTSKGSMGELWLQATIKGPSSPLRCCCPEMEIL